MTLEEMKARLAEVQDRLRAIHEEGGDASLSEERQGEWDGLDAELETLRGQIAAAERRVARVAELGEKKGGAERHAPAVHIKKTEADIFDLDALRRDSSGPGEFSERLMDNAKRAIETVKYASRNKEEAQETAFDLLDNVDQPDTLAKRMLLTGSSTYENAFGKLVRYGSDVMCTMEERQSIVRAAQALGTDANGGYAVPFQLDPTVILTNSGVTNPIRQLARVERIVGKQWQGVTSAGTTVSRGAEAAEAPDSGFTLAQPTVSTNRVQGFVPFSIEIELAWGALRSEITRALVDAKATEEDSFITGDGTGVNPQGLLTGATTTVTAAGTAAFAAADVYSLHTALPPRWEANASFLAHKGIYNLVRQFDTAGGAQMWARIGDGRPGDLMNYPAYASSAMASTLTTANKIMVLGDFSNFLIVDRIGMTVELVPHLLGASGRPTGQRGVYAVWMNNSKVLVPSAFRVLKTG